MKTALSVFVLLCCCVVGFAQTSDSALLNAQKEVKNRLIKDAAYINSVKFDGCRVSLKVNSETLWSPVGSSSGAWTPSGTDGSAYLGPQITSTGGGERAVSERAGHKYEIDLSILDPAKMTIEPFRVKGLTRILIPDNPPGLVRAIKPNPLIENYVHGYPLVVKTKALDKTLRALKGLASLCSGS
jgi:hypothetical protein